MRCCRCCRFGENHHLKWIRAGGERKRKDHRKQQTQALQWTVAHPLSPNRSSARSLVTQVKGPSCLIKKNRTKKNKRRRLRMWKLASLCAPAANRSADRQVGSKSAGHVIKNNRLVVDTGILQVLRLTERKFRFKNSKKNSDPKSCCLLVVRR